MVTPVKISLLRIRGIFADLMHDRNGNAAIEFALIVPLMLTLFFGTLEFSSGVAVDRKVTLVARTMSDLTSRSTTVTDTDLSNFLIVGKSIMTPYSATPLNSTITELYVDPANSTAKVQWSKGSTPLAVGSTVAIPTALQVNDTYLIYAQVDYKYVPAVGYLMDKAGVTLKDETYTRPRQSTCVMYGTTVCTKTLQPP